MSWSGNPVEGALFAPPPAAAAKVKNYATWNRDLVAWLYASQTLELLKSPSSGETSRAGESERDFRVRLQQAGRETRDGSVEKLRKTYAPKMAALQEKIRRAEQMAEREREQASQQKLQAALSVGTTLLGAFLGRKVISAGSLGRASTAARAGSRTWKEMQDVARAGETVEALKQQLADMEAEFTAEVQALESAAEPSDGSAGPCFRQTQEDQYRGTPDCPVLDALLARCARQHPTGGVTFAACAAAVRSGASGASRRRYSSDCGWKNSFRGGNPHRFVEAESIHRLQPHTDGARPGPLLPSTERGSRGRHRHFRG